eukprot:6482449-Amphidinium_carterae.2
MRAAGADHTWITCACARHSMPCSSAISHLKARNAGVLAGVPMTPEKPTSRMAHPVACHRGRSSGSKAANLRIGAPQRLLNTGTTSLVRRLIPAAWHTVRASLSLRGLIDQSRENGTKLRIQMTRSSESVQIATACQELEAAHNVHTIYAHKSSTGTSASAAVLCSAVVAVGSLASPPGVRTPSRTICARTRCALQPDACRAQTEHSCSLCSSSGGKLCNVVCKL